MAIATLAAIYNKIRQLTGSGTSLQLTDATMADAVNSYYSYDFPAQFRSLKLKDIYTFNTIAGIDVYPFNSEGYTTVDQPCYCMKREIKLFQDEWSFYGVWFNWQQQQNFTSGDGTIGPYAGTLSSTPIIRSVNNLSTDLDYPVSRVQNLLITTNVAYGNTLNVTDDGNGNLVGDCVSGTIDYGTGVITNLVFTQAIPSGVSIQCQYNPTQPNIPLGILFYQNQFTLRPVPDRGYTIELTAYRMPSQALLTTPADLGTPELNEWWELIAFGAAKKIYQNRLDPDGIALMEAGIQEMLAKVEARTYAQLGTRRIGTMFSDQLSNNYGGSGWGFGSPSP